LDVGVLNSFLCLFDAQRSRLFVYTRGRMKRIILGNWVLIVRLLTPVMVQTVEMTTGLLARTGQDREVEIIAYREFVHFRGLCLLELNDSYKIAVLQSDALLIQRIV